MRIQIDLESTQHVLVKRKAAALGTSMAGYIRRLVKRDLAQAGAGSAIFGIGDSGGSDIAVDRKGATAEAIAARAARR